MSVRHFLSFMDYSPEELIGLIRRGSELKDLRNRGVLYEPLKSRVLGMVFEKASTRTRLSFEAGMIQLGGQAIFLSPRDTQLGRGEPIGDSARVMSRMLDGVMIRTFAHATLTEFAAHSKVPVINGLSDDLHPCQLLADMQTFHEHRGSIQGKTVAWIGDGNNMCNSYIEAALKFDFQLRVACPGLRAEGRVRRPCRRPPARRPRPARGGGRRAPGEHRRVGLDGPGRRSRRAHRPVPSLPGERRVARWGRRRCTIHALPAGPPRRGKSAKSCWTTRAR